MSELTVVQNRNPSTTPSNVTHYIAQEAAMTLCGRLSRSATEAVTSDQVKCSFCRKAHQRQVTAATRGTHRPVMFCIHCQEKWPCTDWVSGSVERCAGRTATDTPCANRAREDGFCRVHWRLASWEEIQERRQQ